MGLELVIITNEKVKVIRAKVKATQDRDRSYAKLKVKKPYVIKVDEV
jgi:hypothetical protein